MHFCQFFQKKKTFSIFQPASFSYVVAFRLKNGNWFCGSTDVMLLVIYNNHHKWVEHCTTNQPKMRNNFITISSATKNKVKVTQTKSPAIKLGIGYG